MYYFGCIGSKGHYLWANQSEKLWMEIPEGFPEEWTFDDPYNKRKGAKESRIAPNAYGTQGVALIQHFGGWTCVSFPDRSVDSRPNCVSAFMERGDKTFGEMMEIAKKEYPGVLARYDFEIVVAT